MESIEFEYLNGWYEKEQDEKGPFRWMEKQAFVRLANCSLPSKKTFRIIAGHTFPDKTSPVLQIFANGQLVLKEKIQATASPYFFYFSDTGTITLEFRLDSVFKIPEDSRNLGIIVRSIEIIFPQETDIIYGRGWHEWEPQKHFPFHWMSRRAFVLLSDSWLQKNRYLYFFARTEFDDFSQTLIAEFHGKIICKIPLLPDWNHYSIYLPQSKKAKQTYDDGNGFKMMVLTLNKSIPKRLRKVDTRDLGIQVNRISFHNDDQFHKDFLFFYRNAYMNYKEMLEGKTVLESYPPYLGIDIYGKCNIKPPCVYCEWEWFKIVEGEYVNAVVDEKTLEGYGPFFRAARNLINCSIGEPLIHPRLKQILELCERKKKIFEMATNGQNLTKDTIRTLAGKRVDLFVSLDAAKRETYAKIRNDKWDTIIPNLILLNEERKKSCVLPRILMVFMPMRINRADLEDFFRLCQKAEADVLILRPLNRLNKPKSAIKRAGHIFNYEEEMLSREELEEIFQKCEEYSRKYHVPVGNQFDFGLIQNP